MQLSSTRWIGLSLVLAVVGMLQLVWTTRSGPGVSPDSVQYLYAARTFGEGRGFLSIYENDGNGALTHYPPGYPIALAVASGLRGPDALLTAGTYTNILLWGASLFLVMFLLYHFTGRHFLALLFGVFMLSSVDLFRIHEMIWSEPLYFLLSLMALWKLSEHITTGNRRDLALAVVCAALAATTRYIGIVLVFSMASVVLLRWRANLGQRLIRAALTGMLSGLLLLAWLIRSRLVSHSMTNREFGYHPMTADYWSDLLEALGEYFLQVLQLQQQSRIAGGLIIIGTIVLLVRYRRSLFAFLQTNTFAFALVFCNVSYLLFLGFSNTFLDHTPFYYRIVYPILVQLMIAAGLFVDRWVESRTWSYRKRVGAIAFISLYLCVHISDHARYLLRKDDANGYFSQTWRKDAVLTYIRTHPKDAVCSNAQDVLYVHTGRVLPPLAGMTNAEAGTLVAVFANGAFRNGRSSTEDLLSGDVHAPARLELMMDGPHSRLYRVR
ncbi:MAG: hypothetical protein JNL43_17030 [Flavobacteriales bacterium]|nr:hypothetical protein [Flavobacteriales bacterium]